MTNVMPAQVQGWHADENGKEQTFTLEENISAKWRTIGHLIKLTPDTLNGYETQFKENGHR